MKYFVRLKYVGQHGDKFHCQSTIFSQRHEKHMLILKVTHALQMLTSSHNFVEMLLGDLSKVKMAICPCKTFLTNDIIMKMRNPLKNPALISNLNIQSCPFVCICNFFHRTLDYMYICLHYM